MTIQTPNGCSLEIPGRDGASSGKLIVWTSRSMGAVQEIRALL